jgi:hypothetical protein
MVKITDVEHQNLHEQFETAGLLDAISLIDDMRGYLGESRHLAPLQVQTNLSKLHQLALEVIEDGQTEKTPELFDLASELEMQMDDMREALESVQETLTQLMALCPKSLLCVEE